MTSATEWAGVGRGFERAAQVFYNRDLRKAQIEEAKMRQEKSKMELEEFKAQAPLRETQYEAQQAQLQAQTYQLNAEMLKNQTYDAFQRWDAGGEVKHLNNFLQYAHKNTLGQGIYGDIVRYDRLSRSPETDQLIREAGYQNPGEVYYNDDLVNDFVVATDNTGNQHLVSVNQMKIETGYTEHMSDKQLERMETQARIQAQLQRGVSSHKVTMQERVAQDLIESGKAENFADAYSLIKQMEAQNSGRGALTTTEERAVERIMEDQNVDFLTALDTYHRTRRQDSGATDQERFVQDYLERNPEATREDATREYRNLAETTKTKDIESASTYYETLDSMNFLETDLAEMSTVERGQIYHKYIRPLEAYSGAKFSSEEKRTIRDLRDLAQLGDTAGEEITSKETGVLDKLLHNFKKYVTDNVEGVKGVSAYETFRNVIRHSLYGSALTGNEIKAFNTAAGGLGQQLGPVLMQLQTQMQSIKNQMEAIRDLEDPYVAHYYLGMSNDQIDETIRNIETRIDELVKPNAKQGDIRVRRTDTPKEASEVSTPTGAFDFDNAMREAGL